MKKDKTTKEYTIEGVAIPPQYEPIGAKMLTALIRYERYGDIAGGFFESLAANDLRRAILNADDANFANIKLICLWLGNMVSPESCGSYAKVTEWQKTRAHNRTLSDGSTEDCRRD